MFGLHTGFIFSRFLKTECRKYLWLSLLWVVGLLSGIYLAATGTNQNDPIVYTALAQSPSIILQALISSLTLITIALLRYNQCFLPMIPILFLQSFSRGFSGMSLFIWAGEGSWVIRILFLFSGTCVSVVTWWLLLRHSDSKKSELAKVICLSVVAVLIVIMVDYLVISPFLVSIINQIF